jgi:hypothetical protein
MRYVLGVAFFSLSLFAAEAEGLDEAALKRVETLLEEGDVATGVPLLFKILRDAPDKEHRKDARETLEKMGVSKAEILQLDPALLKPEDMEKFNTRARERLVRKLDVEYAKDLMRTAVSPRVSAGEVVFDVHQKELCRSIELLLQAALVENGGDVAREAQEELEEMGIVGARVAAVKQAFAIGEVPAEVQKEVIFNVCLNRLDRYKDWMEDDGPGAEDTARRHVARDLGASILKYLQKHHGQSPRLQRSDVLDYWRGEAKPKRTD